MAALHQFDEPDSNIESNGYRKTTSLVDAEAALRHNKHARPLLVGLLTILNSAGAICLAGTKQGRKDFPFEFVTVVFLQECCKLVIALVCFSQDLHYNPRVHEAGVNEFSWGMFFLFGVPALLYSFDNNFQYMILHFLKPAELTILWNFKIVMTAILMRVFLKQKQTQKQWFALGLLIVGCFLTQAQNLLRHPGKDAVSTDGAARKIWGMMLAFLGSSIMAASNVFCEWLVKHKPRDSIHFQNMQLYFFGACMNLVALMGKAISTPDSPVNEGFFTGYNGWTWCLLVAGSVSGIAISFTLKFVDNIAVVFSHALAMLSVTIISALFFDLRVSLELFVGVGVVVFSLFMYYVDDPDVLLRTFKGETRQLRMQQKGDTSMYCFNDPQQ